MRCHPGAVLLSRSSPLGTSCLQHLRHGVCDWGGLLGVPPCNLPREGKQSLAASAYYGVNLLRVQHGTGGRGDLSDGTQVAGEDLVGVLLLVVPVLPGGSRNRRVNELDQRNHRLANLAAGAAGCVPHLPFVSPLSG